MSTQIGDLLHAYRRRENISLNELAERTDMSKTALSKIESGETKQPGFSQWKRIASVIKIPSVDVITAYLENTERPATLQLLLKEALALDSKQLVQRTAQKLLDTPKLDTFHGLDYLLRVANEAEDQSAKLALYDVLIDFTRKRGIPFYLAKGLYERYMLERDDFSRFEETYRRGKELLHYVDQLQPPDRLDYYYRMGAHAYILEYYGESVELCGKAISEDGNKDSKQKASALISMGSAYLRLEYPILAEYYLELYEESEYADFRKTHLRALLHAKKGEYAHAVALYTECLQEAKPGSRITIASDLLDVYLEAEQSDAIQELIAAEHTFLTIDSHPNRIKHAARYYKRKGMCLLSIGQADAGIDSLMQSLRFYRQIGALEKVIGVLGVLFGYHREIESSLSLENMEKIMEVCHN
ncbi:helix-turn-helix transcriptional regulator [Brevibacillus antibioticus]|uniref:Helix-turn-helix transcriptional regulator n=1 Tax=Brevibacillus antibioticus TaxID=2570228 RepID=A0A4U2YHJ3_9BACL|nr:helix-turn-helix transcriptional regulator [Brevibacillus antibioticus]TKI59051.1 helix-turn-helix transcriptional regulator [Brevibacillus antibioticus]